MSYAQDLIDNVFGGIRPAARALDKAASTIQGWYEAGTIPQKHWSDVISAAAEFNHNLTADDFFPKTVQTQSEPPQVSSTQVPAQHGYAFEKLHCLSIADFHRVDIENLLELGAHYLDLSVQKTPREGPLRGKTLINLFFENSTRTEKSFELAGGDHA